MRVFVELGLVFFPHQAKRLTWGNVSEVTYFYCRVGRKISKLSQSSGGVRELQLTQAEQTFTGNTEIY